MPWRREQIAYCGNVHPGADLSRLTSNIGGPIAGVRRRRRLRRMGCGLWLAAPAAQSLAAAPERLPGLLEAAGLELVTLNGFPFGDFHRERVKEAVYAPAWDEAGRLAYSLDLARILARCLPEDEAEGTVSTVPLGFAPEWGPERHARALDQLCTLAGELAALRARTGRSIRLCLEPEPGCVLETTPRAIELFTRELPAAAHRLGVPQAALARHLGVCLDVCHQAVMFEDPGDSLTRLAAAGVTVGKVQVSSALVVPDPARADLEQVLGPFAEPRYLHQVRCEGGGGLLGVMDLPEALSDPSALPRDGPWRVHFHVPIQAEAMGYGALATTRDAIPALLGRLAADPSLRPHLEVETYTWQVLPPGRRPATRAALEAGLAAELAWLEGEMAARGLLTGKAP